MEHGSEWGGRESSADCSVLHAAASCQLRVKMSQDGSIERRGDVERMSRLQLSDIATTEKGKQDVRPGRLH